MKTLVFFSTLTLFSLKLSADSPGEARQYTRYSENGQFYFVSIPFTFYGLTDFGKTTVYAKDKKKMLYKIDQYFSPNVTFISNDGRVIVKLNTVIPELNNFKQQKLLEFFVLGKIQTTLNFEDLINDTSCLFKTAKFAIWHKNIEFQNDTLKIQTRENQQLIVPISTGRIVDRKVFHTEDGTNFFNIKNNAKLTYNQDIVYIHTDCLPNLKNGKTFKESFMKAMNLSESKNNTNYKYYLDISIALDRKGRSELLSTQSKVDGKIDLQWGNQVAQWIKKQRFKTDLIPKNCDKWIFSTRLYLF